MPGGWGKTQSRQSAIDYSEMHKQIQFFNHVDSELSGFHLHFLSHFSVPQNRWELYGKIWSLCGIRF
jgi:hypothetical protein